MRYELTVYNVTLQLKYLWNRHCENNYIKLFRWSHFPEDFPFPISERDAGYMLFIEDICTCLEKEVVNYM